MEDNELDITCGMTDDEMTERFIAAVRIADEIKRIKGVPIARYDGKNKRVYLEYPDGRKEYVSEQRKNAGNHCIRRTKRQRKIYSHKSFKGNRTLYQCRRHKKDYTLQ